MSGGRAPDHARRAVGLTRAGMWWEALARAFWPLGVVLALVVAALAFGAPELFSNAALAWVSGLVALGVLCVAAWGLWRFRRPAPDGALERVDRALPGRPLSALRDRVAVGAGDEGADALWSAHLARMARVAAGARAIAPDARLRWRDPVGLRLVGLTYHIPAATHADTPALMVLANILSYSPGGRLHKALVEPQLAAAAFAGAGAQREPGTFTFVAVPPKDSDPAKAEAELLKQAEAIAATPITAQELADAKQRIANSYELSFNDVNRIGLAMSEYVAAGDWRLYFVLRDAMDKVSVDDVNRVAKQYLIPSNRTLARFVPTDNAVRADIAAAPPVATLVDGYTGREAVAAGEAFDPSIENIAARSEIITLGNGLQVSLLPTRYGRQS